VEDATLVGRAVTCPLCKSGFTYCRPKSGTYKLLGRDSDYCPYYEGRNPLFYHVWVCPNCQFAAYKEHFGQVEPGKVHALKETLTALVTARADFSRPERTMFVALQAYQVALVCYQARAYPPEMIGQVALRLAWICRYGGQAKRELDFLDQARQHLTEAYDKGIRTKGFIDFQGLTYMVGELNLRTGHLAKATACFATLMRTKGLTDPMRVAGAARQDAAEAAETVGKRLESVDVLEPLGSAGLGILAQRSRIRRVPKGEILYEDGEPGGSLIVVVKGCCSLYRSGPGSRLETVMEAGDSCSEQTLFTGEPRVGTLVAGPPDNREGPETVVAEIERADLHAVLRLFPKAAEGITARLNLALEEAAAREWVRAAREAEAAPRRQERSIILDAVSSLFGNFAGAGVDD